MTWSWLARGGRGGWPGRSMADVVVPAGPLAVGLTTALHRAGLPTGPDRAVVLTEQLRQHRHRGRLVDRRHTLDRERDGKNQHDRRMDGHREGEQGELHTTDQIRGDQDPNALVGHGRRSFPARRPRRRDRECPWPHRSLYQAGRGAGSPFE